jgi:shikimate dehydrogenase
MQHVGLIGLPVAHSLSPRMQQAAFDACGISARYMLWETQPNDLPARIASLRAPDMLGANVTLPYKTDVLVLVDEVEPLAASVGAINTIVNRDGRLVGYNTDVQGMLQALAEMGRTVGSPSAGAKGGAAIKMAAKGLRPTGAALSGDFNRRGAGSWGISAVILGTGGAARAAAIGLIQRGVETLTLLGRTLAHLDALCQHVQAFARASGSSATVQARLLGSEECAAALAHADLLINATPVGLAGKEQAVLIDVEELPTSALVLDMIFNPPETPLLQAARACGCLVLNGLPMLLYQGALAFTLWTGQDAPVEVMRRALMG